MEAFAAWLGEVPLGLLYLFIFLAALIEGILPLMPGDVAAALLAFLAARAGGDLALTITLVTTGSILGAIIMWGIGRRYGVELLKRLFHRMGWAGAEHRTEAAEHRVAVAYRRSGWVALFVSRFLPGVRAVVPGVAGAMRLPFWEITIIFTVASTLWYGGISFIAFRVGKDWESVRTAIGGFARDVGLGAVAVAGLLLLLFWRARRKRGPRA
jgi:membrane protein DedA with SNARE-associated domain